MAVKLSILIPSTPQRLEFLSRLLTELTQQAADRPVEVLVFLDNKQRTLGAMRNALIEMAQGEYVAFVDDDDWVEPQYVQAILDTVDRNPGVDCIVFDVAFYLYGKFIKIFRYGQEYGWQETDDCIFREPSPWMCWSREIAIRYKFPDQNVAEDSAWIAAGPWKKEKIHQERIPTVLYHYHALPGHQ